MGAFTDYLENKLLDHSLGTASYTKPTAVYLGLFTAAPGESGGGTEVSGGGYARQAVTFNAASGGTTLNSSDITFPTATANWGTITHVALFDASTGGNMLYYGALTSSVVINSGQQFVILAGDLDITLD
ncbi:MAG: hypothetical protein QXX77_09815 [Candidatus Methanosuratincola sp.]|jgi:hypothetical protein